MKKKLPKVNKELAARLLTAKDRRGGAAEAVVDDDGETVEERPLVGGKASVLTDDRFSSLFNDEVYILKHPLLMILVRQSMFVRHSLDVWFQSKMKNYNT